MTDQVVAILFKMLHFLATYLAGFNLRRMIRHGEVTLTSRLASAEDRSILSSSIFVFLLSISASLA